MAGIFGLLQFEKKYDLNQTCKSLLIENRQGFNHLGNYLIDSDGCFGFGYCLEDYYTNTQWPLKSKDERYWFQIWGNIILPNGNYVDHTNFDDAFLQEFLNNRIKFLQQIDGEYVFVLYDHESKKLLIVNDIFGNFALHYHKFGQGVIFSTNISAIRKIIENIKLDHHSLLEYLGISQNMNGKTLFEQVNRLRPAVYLDIGSTDFIERQYYEPEYLTNKGKTDRTLLPNQFATSVKNRLQNRSVLAALTGGFDTRATWSIIHSLGKSKYISAATHGMPACRDILISKKISKIMGAKHFIFYYDEDFIKHLPKFWLKLVELGEGSIPLSSAHALAYWEYCSQYGKIMVDSHGGALYRRQYMKYAQRYLTPGPQFVEKFLHIIRSPLLKFNLLNNNISQEIRSICKASILEYFESIDHISNIGAKIDLFYVHQISAFKYSVAANVQQNYIGVHHPFLNPQLFNMIQKIPESFHHQNWLHKKIIESYYPRLKYIQLDNMGLPALYWGFRTFRYLPMIYERIIEKSANFFNGYFKNMSIRKFVTDYHLFLLANIDFAKEVLLGNNKIFNEFFEKKLVENHIDLFIKGNLNIGDGILQLLAFKLFLDKFA